MPSLEFKNQNPAKIRFWHQKTLQNSEFQEHFLLICRSGADLFTFPATDAVAGHDQGHRSGRGIGKTQSQRPEGHGDENSSELLLFDG